MPSDATNPPPQAPSPYRSTSSCRNGAGSHTAKSNICTDNKRPRHAERSKRTARRGSSSSASVASSASICFSKVRTSRTVLLRSILVGCLLAAAGVCAAVAYSALTAAEVETAQQTYNSIAASALNNARTNAARKLRAAEVTAAVASFANPNADDWPFITVNGYTTITGKIAAMAESTTQSLKVIVTPSQVADFEAHLEQVYRDQGRPEGSGYSDFGFGVWKPDPNTTHPTYEDGRVHDSTGENNWGGKRKILAVLSMHNVPNSTSLMYNAYSEEDRGIHIDSMLECAEGHNENAIEPSCPVVTDVIELKIRPGPAALIIQPIYPANHPSTIVGFATTAVHWGDILANIVPDYVSGLTCVVSTSTSSFTYEIRDGMPQLVGPSDVHNPVYESYAQSVTLVDIETGASSSATYNLTVYPTEAMFSTFQTGSPLAVALAFLGVIFLCTVLFFAYDYLMRHEAHQRRMILDVKRRFVRFISHEIRTPLNTVCLGLEMLERELLQDCARRRSNITVIPTAEGGEGPAGDTDAAFSTPTAEDIIFWHAVTAEVKENAGMAVTILNDLLNYDKIETGSLHLETKEVNIVDLVFRTVNQFQMHAVSRDIDLQLTWEGQPAPDLDPSEPASKVISPDSAPLSRSAIIGDASAINTSPPPHAILDLESSHLCVLGDDVRLSQVLRNIVSNSLKFTPPDGSVHVTVCHQWNGLPDVQPLVVDGEPIGDERRRGAISIRISDTGVGLSKEELRLVFGEGVQFEANKLQHGGGSGLGLSIAKGIVELHHGTIKAESNGSDQGTTFTIELPIYESINGCGDDDCEETFQIQDQTEVAMSLCEDLHNDNIECKTKRILVVEDSVSSRKMLIRLLEREGYVCGPAVDGKDAVQVITKDMEEARENPSTHVVYDTILMDFEMPILKGPDAARHIRELGYKGTIIGVTGNVLSEDVEYFKESGADEVLAKPISLAKLREYFD